MADRVVPGPVESSACIREAVCINTNKIFDSCRDKDCVDDLRVFPTVTSQSYIENALSVRAKAAELLYVQVNVEPITFNRGYYTVDCTYFYKITGETFPNAEYNRACDIRQARYALRRERARQELFFRYSIADIVGG